MSSCEGKFNSMPKKSPPFLPTLSKQNEKKCLVVFLSPLEKTYFVSECVLFQVVWLDELHATLTADVRSDVFVFHHVVLKLAGVLERLLALRAPASTALQSYIMHKTGKGKSTSMCRAFCVKQSQGESRNSDSLWISFGADWMEIWLKT